MSTFGRVVASYWAYFLFRIDAIFYSGLPVFFWNRPKWSLDSIPDQSGKVVIVTGGNSGTGYATCKALYEKGATVYLACRSRKKALKAIDDIQRGADYDVTGVKYPAIVPDREEGKELGRLEFLELDLADLSDIERCVREFEQKEQHLDVLYANAGVMASPEGLHTSQGYTLQFGTNCLGHQRFISLLLPLLLRTSASNPSSLPRVISLSSAGHATAPRGGVDYRSVVKDEPQYIVDGKSQGFTYGTISEEDEDKRRGRYELMRWIEYGQSKWGDIALARWLHWSYGPSEGRRKELVEGAQSDRIISMAIHPGFVATNLAQHISLTPYILRRAPWAISLIARPATDGALNQLWAGTCPEDEARRLSGEYIVPCQKVGRARPDLDELETVKAVWDWCEEQSSRGRGRISL